MQQAQRLESDMFGSTLEGLALRRAGQLGNIQIHWKSPEGPHR